MDIRVNTLIERGGLQCLWHPAESYLRRIRAGKEEILRGVYFALRNADWDTVAPVVRDAGFDESVGGWRLWQDLYWRDGAVNFEGRLEVEVSGAEELRFRFDGRALSEFRSNRIGFLVLHGAECAGSPVAVEKTDGSVVDGCLPCEIAPWQPFTDIRAVTHTPADGVEVCVRMEGEAFEMEDQRNWTDSSFKTYSTPLSLPFPRLIETGTRIVQQVTVSIQRTAGGIAAVEREMITVTEHTERGQRPFPQLGFEDAPEEAVDMKALQALHPDHLRVEIHPTHPNWRTVWREAAERARNVGAALETALFVSDTGPDGVGALVEELLHTDVRHARWLVFDADAKVTRASTLAAVRAARDSRGAKVPLFSGTDAFFTEINRERPPVEGVRGVVFSSNPSVHAVDDLSFVETHPMLGLCVENAARFGTGVVCVSPLTFKMRRNPNATTPEGVNVPTEKQVDPRQWTPWGAAWTLGALKHLAESDVESVTCFKTAGPTGLFPGSGPGAGSPLAELFGHLAEWKDSSVVCCKSTHPLEITALYLLRGAKRVVFAGNLSGGSLDVSFSWGPDNVRRVLPPGITWFVMGKAS